MLTFTKYFGSALFLTAVFFIAALDSPDAFSAILSNVAVGNPDRAKNVLLLVRTWIGFSALLALVGIGLRLVFPWSLPGAGRLSVKALPGRGSGAAD